MSLLGLRSVLVCSLALAMGMPLHARANLFSPVQQGQADVPRQGRVFVDASALGDAGPYLAGQATKRAGDCLVDEGVKHTEAPAGPELRMTIKPGEPTGYTIAYEIVFDGAVMEDGKAKGSSDCQLCTEDELLDRIDAIAREQAPKMVEPEAEPEVVDHDPDPEVVVTPPGGEGGHDEPEGMGGMGKAGVALLVVGGASAVTGVVLVVRKPEHFPAGDPNANMVKTTRPPGAAVLGGGVALAITGAVLLALDVKRRKKTEDAGATASGKAAARIHPWLGPGGAGLGVTGRF